MIELVTGLPGNGKTLYTIADVKKRAEAENRQVYYNGIPQLSEALNWIQLDDPKQWASCPPNSIIVLDEAQKTFRNRSVGAQPPPFVTDLETHRHLGIDLVMITQHPSLVDPSVRRLAGRHRHMVRMWGMEASTVHKWDAVKDNCDKSRADSEKSKWAFDKSVYALYKSAEVHTMKRSIPGRVKLLIAVPFLLAAAGYYVYSTVVKKPQLATSPAAVAVGPGPGGTMTSPSAARFDPVQDARSFVEQNTPRVAGLPHTAPKYDEITKPVRAPIPAACIQRGLDKCNCLTQQGTPMEVEFNMCVQFARNGWFQDFKEEGGSSGTPLPLGNEKPAATSSPPSSEKVGAGSQIAVLPPPPEQPRIGGQGKG